MFAVGRRSNKTECGLSAVEKSVEEVILVTPELEFGERKKLTVRFPETGESKMRST